MNITIDVDEIMARAPEGSSDRENYEEIVSGILCAHLNLWTRGDADTTARTLDYKDHSRITRAIREGFFSGAKGNISVDAGYVEKADDAGWERKTRADKKRGNRYTYTFRITKPTASFLPPHGNVMADPVREQRAIILHSSALETDGVYRVRAVVPVRKNSLVLKTVEMLYAGRFLFPIETPQELAFTEAQKKNFVLVNTRYEELEKAGLLP